MKKALLALTLLLASSPAFASHIYSTRAEQTLEAMISTAGNITNMTIYPSTAGVGPANTAKLRYLQSSNQLQVSLNGAAYTALGGGSITIGTTTVTGGTTNSLLKESGGVVQDSAWIDTGTLLYSTTDTGFGLGTATPKTWLTYTSGGTVLQATSAGVTEIAVAGTTPSFNIIETDGTVDHRVTQIVYESSILKFRDRLNDGSTGTQWMSWDNPNDTLTIGSAAVTGVSYISGLGNHTFSDGEMLNSEAAITAGSGTGVTVNVTAGLRETVYKVTVSSTNCIAAATTCDLTIATLPAKTILRQVFADLTTSYACAATCTTATLSGAFGTSAGGTELLASMDLDAAAALFGDADAELGTSMNAAAVTANGAMNSGVLFSWTGTTTLTYRITSAVGNLGTGAATNLSQGTVTFYLVAIRMP